MSDLTPLTPREVAALRKDHHMSEKYFDCACGVLDCPTLAVLNGTARNPEPIPDTPSLREAILALDYRIVEWWSMDSKTYSLVQVVSRSEAAAIRKKVTT